MQSVCALPEEAVVWGAGGSFPLVCTDIVSCQPFSRARGPGPPAEERQPRVSTPPTPTCF